MAIQDNSAGEWVNKDIAIPPKNKHVFVEYYIGSQRLMDIYLHDGEDWRQLNTIGFTIMYSHTFKNYGIHSFRWLDEKIKHNDKIKIFPATHTQS